LQLSLGVRRTQPTSLMDTVPSNGLPHHATPAARRGGRAGWFRVAAGFSALAAVGSGYQAWSVLHPSAGAVVHDAPSLGAAIGAASALFAAASLLAMRHRLAAGLCLLIGYAVPAATFYAQRGEIMPPSLLLTVSMLALMLAALRRSAVGDAAA
jgi:hypothetical protein